MDVKLILMVLLILVAGSLFGYEFWLKAKTMTREQKIELAKGVALSLVVLAEEKFGAKTGPIKYSWVVLEIYKTLPAFIVKYITPDIIDDAIEKALEEMKKLLYR